MFFAFPGVIRDAYKLGDEQLSHSFVALSSVQGVGHEKVCLRISALPA